MKAIQLSDVCYTCAWRTGMESSSACFRNRAQSRLGWQASRYEVGGGCLISESLVGFRRDPKK